jgi:hypothetical protein
MAKTLKNFLEGYLKVKSADEQKFIDKHVTAKNPDRNGNGDEVFNGKTKAADRRKERHGYNPGEDEKVYEELKGNQHKIDANKNGKVDAHDFKLLRRKKKVAEAVDSDLENELKATRQTKKSVGGKWKSISYKTADGKWATKDVKEESEQIDELSKATLATYAIKAKNQMGKDEARAGYQRGIRTMDGKGQGAMERAHDKRAEKRSKGIDNALNRLAKEEVQIDELSKGTLASYVKKAAGSAANNAMEHGKKKAEQDEVDRLTNRHMSFGDKDKIHKTLKTTHRDVEAPREKAGKRIQGINRAVTKLAKEEVEQITEVNANQIKKDLDSGMSHDAVIGKHANKRTTNTDEIRKVIKQHAWDKRMKKEEVELDEKIATNAPMGTYIKDFQKSDAPQFKGKSSAKRRVMAIAAKLTAERGGKPLNKEERLIDRLSDISESHQRALLNVFESLNEDNKTKFMLACSTPEGIDQMLDFAISHRGE